MYTNKELRQMLDGKLLTIITISIFLPQLIRDILPTSTATFIWYLTAAAYILDYFLLHAFRNVAFTDKCLSWLNAMVLAGIGCSIFPVAFFSWISSGDHSRLLGEWGVVITIVLLLISLAFSSFTLVGLSAGAIKYWKLPRTR